MARGRRRAVAGEVGSLGQTGRSGEQRQRDGTAGGKKKKKKRKEIKRNKNTDEAVGQTNSQVWGLGSVVLVMLPVSKPLKGRLEMGSTCVVALLEDASASGGLWAS